MAVGWELRRRERCGGGGGEWSGDDDGWWEGKGGAVSVMLVTGWVEERRAWLPHGEAGLNAHIINRRHRPARVAAVGAAWGMIAWRRAQRVAAGARMPSTRVTRHVRRETESLASRQWLRPHQMLHVN